MPGECAYWNSSGRRRSRWPSLRAQLEHVSRVTLAGELAASLSHEVSQPLGAIVNNAEAGRRNLDRYIQRPDQLGAIFDDIVADGMRASEVVRGLRRYLRPRELAVGSPRPHRRRAGRAAAPRPGVAG